jgi:protein subunit release factor B
MFRSLCCRLAICRLPTGFAIPKSCYDIQMCRGGGPGGQGANSSSNKVELRLDLTKLHVECSEVDSDLLSELRRKYDAYVSKEDLLILTSHEHRSAQKNEEACVQRALAMLKDASSVPEPPPPPLEHNPAVLRHAIDKRRIQSNKTKASLSARRQKLSGSSW